MALRDRSIVEMVADVRNRSGLESSQFRTDADITRYLNESGYKLTGKIIAEHPDANYLYKSGTISTTSGTSAYDLPNDCFQPLAFRVTLDGVRINIAKGDIDDLDTEVTNQGWGLDSFNRPTHMLMGFASTFTGVQVIFMPTPTATYTVTVHYIPQLPFANVSGTSTRLADMTSGTSNHNVMSEWGWEEWVVLDTSIKIKNDQEEDPRALMMERQEIWQMISSMVSNRTVTEAPKVRDAYGASYRENQDYRYR